MSKVDSIGDSQIRTVLIQHAGWAGRQYGWADHIQWIFANAWLPWLRPDLACHQAAEQLKVGVSTAIIRVRRLRETGSVAPGRWVGTCRREFPASKCLVAGAHQRKGLHLVPSSRRAWPQG